MGVTEFFLGDDGLTGDDVLDALMWATLLIPGGAVLGGAAKGAGLLSKAVKAKGLVKGSQAAARIAGKKTARALSGKRVLKTGAQVGGSILSLMVLDQLLNTLGGNPVSSEPRRLATSLEPRVSQAVGIGGVEALERVLHRELTGAPPVAGMEFQVEELAGDALRDLAQVQAMKGAGIYAKTAAKMGLV